MICALKIFSFSLLKLLTSFFKIANSELMICLDLLLNSNIIVFYELSLRQAADWYWQCSGTVLEWPCVSFGRVSHFLGMILLMPRPEQHPCDAPSVWESWAGMRIYGPSFSSSTFHMNPRPWRAADGYVQTNQFCRSPLRVCVCVYATHGPLGFCDSNLAA